MPFRRNKTAKEKIITPFRRSNTPKKFLLMGKGRYFAGGACISYIISYLCSLFGNKKFNIVNIIET